MQITVNRDERYNRAEVSATLPSGLTPSIDVYGPEVRFGEIQPARVNWSALGSQSPEDAAAYAELLAEAARVAAEMNR